MRGDRTGWRRPPGASRHYDGVLPLACPGGDRTLCRTREAVRLRGRLQGGGARDHSVREHREPGPDCAHRPTPYLARRRFAPCELRLTLAYWLKAPAALSASAPRALSSSPAKGVTFAGEKHAG